MQEVNSDLEGFKVSTKSLTLFCGSNWAYTTADRITKDGKVLPNLLPTNFKNNKTICAKISAQLASYGSSDAYNKLYVNLDNSEGRMVSSELYDVRCCQFCNATTDKYLIFGEKKYKVIAEVRGANYYRVTLGNHDVSKTTLLEIMTGLEKAYPKLAFYIPPFEKFGCATIRAVNVNKPGAHAEVLSRLVLKTYEEFICITKNGKDFTNKVWWPIILPLNKLVTQARVIAECAIQCLENGSTNLIKAVAERTKIPKQFGQAVWLPDTVLLSLANCVRKESRCTISIRSYAFETFQRVDDLIALTELPSVPCHCGHQYAPDEDARAHVLNCRLHNNTQMYRCGCGTDFEVKREKWAMVDHMKSCDNHGSFV